MMDSKKFNELLLQRFPEIREDFEKYVSSQDGIETGSFLIMEDIFVGFLAKAISEKKEDTILRVFSFAEAMLNQGDEYACNLIVVGLLESIKTSDWAKGAEPYMLSNTRKEYESLTL